MELWQHQKQAVEKARNVKNLALFMEAGVGKTGAMIHILRDEYNRNRDLTKTLIFAPVSVCPQWKTEFLRFSKIDAERITVLQGSGKKRCELFKKNDKAGHIFITNYEAVQMEELLQLLYDWKPETVVIDESHRIKDSSSVRAKKIYTLTDRAHRKFLLTGTPVLNSMLDLFGQMRALDPSLFGRSFFYFKNKYFYDKNAGMPAHVHWPEWIPREGADKMISEVLAPISVQAKKSECLDLPPLLNVEIPVELGMDQAKAYSEMTKEFVAELNGELVTAEFAMTKTLRLMQILAGFVQPDEKAQATWCKDLPRMDALKDILMSISTNKAIIWTNFRSTYPRIGELCDKLKLKYTFLTGDQNSIDKQKNIEAFRSGDTQIIIANPAAGGTGVNLTEAKYAIYYTKSYSLEHYLQSQARNYRGGSTMHESVTHYHIYTKGTLDEIISSALVNKKKVGDAILEWCKTLEK